MGLLLCHRSRKNDDEEDSDGERGRPRKRGKKMKEDDGLTAKQKRKVRSKATISSSDDDSDAGKRSPDRWAIHNALIIELSVKSSSFPPSVIMYIISFPNPPLLDPAF